MTACAAGTYNPSKLQYDISHCITCPAQTYSSTTASTACSSCGNTSKAPAGSTSCSCIGNNRKFLASTKWCICVDRYESATAGNTQSDSTEDCSSKLVSTCPDTSDTEGNCVSSTESCYTACGTNGGTRVLGLCDCNAKTLTNAVCPLSCRSSRNTISISATGDISITDSNGDLVSTLSISLVVNLQGSMKYSASQENQIVSIGLSSKSFTANYEASTYFQTICTSCNAARRGLSSGSHRNLASTGAVTNPVICISTGDSLLFDVDSSTGSYPVYVSGSLLNTNTDFDYGEFLSLGTTIAAGTTVNQFVFQFNTAGVYVFENSLDSSQQMVLGVMGSSSKCPDSSEYISPTSLKSLLLIGAAESDVVYEPNWVFIILLIIGIMVLIGLMIAVYYYLVKADWFGKYRRKIKYRKVNLKGEDLTSIRADNACFDYMQKNKEQRFNSRMKQKANREIRYSEIEDVRARLKKHIDTLKGDIFWDGGQGGDSHFQQTNIDKENIMLQLQKLKDLINDHKRNIEGDFDEHYSDEDESSPLKKRQGALGFLNDNDLVSKELGQDIVNEGNKLDDDELNKMMMQLQKRKENIDRNVDNEVDNQTNDLVNRIQALDEDADGDLKKKLLEELRDKLDRIDNSLKDEENAQLAALEAKLAQRKKRRGMIVDDFVKLQREKQDLNDNSYVRREIDKKMEEKYQNMEEELEQERQEGLKILRENNETMEQFEDKLRKGLTDKKNFDKHLEEYTKNKNKMQDAVRKEQMEQEKQLNDELKKRRDARIAKIEAERGELMEEAKASTGEKLRDLEEKERAFNGLKVKELDPFLKDIVKKSEQKVGNRRELDLIRAEADRALARYRAAEGEERDRIRRELMEKYKDDDEIENNEIRSLREQLLKEILDKEEEKEATLAKFKGKLDEAASSEDKQKLIDEHNKYKLDIEEELRSMAENGANVLEQRLRDRRAKRKQEEDQLLAERMKDVNDKKKEDEVQQKSNVENVRDDLEERTIEEIVRELQNAIPKEEVPSALEKIMDDRQMKELIELLLKQYEEKSQAMKDAVMKIIDKKSEEIDALNKEMAEAKGFLREAYEKGGITEDIFNEEIKKIKKRHEQRLADIDAKYNTMEIDTQQEIVKNFVGKHMDEQIELEEKHMREREKFFSKLLPESAMKRILRGMVQVEQEKIDDIIREKREERDARLLEHEEKMSKFRLEISQTQKELDDLDEYQRKLREKEIAAQRKLDIQQQKILEKKRREQEAELTQVRSKEQREEMVKKHLEELQDLNRILGVERKRQIDIHRQMFEDKRAAIEKRRQELLEQRSEQERQRKEKMEEEEKRKKEMSELEKKRQERMLKLTKDNNSKLVVYDKPAYSQNVDMADRMKFRRDYGREAASGKNQYITKEEQMLRKIEKIQKSNRGPLTLDLLGRIMRLEDIATELNEKDQELQ